MTSDSTFISKVEGSEEERGGREGSDTGMVSVKCDAFKAHRSSPIKKPLDRQMSGSKASDRARLIFDANDALFTQIISVRHR